MMSAERQERRGRDRAVPWRGGVPGMRGLGFRRPANHLHFLIYYLSLEWLMGKIL